MNKFHDSIEVYRSGKGFRWQRRASGNHRIVGASTEEYSRLSFALKNVKRTQKAPYNLQVLDDDPVTIDS